MSRLASPRARARLSLGILLSAAVSCVPSHDLDDYRSNGGAAAVDDATTPLTPTASTPGNTAGAAGRATTPPASGEVGAGASSSGGEATSPDLPLSASGAASMQAGAVDTDPTGAACAADERLGPNGHCYFFSGAETTWALARSACQQRGPSWDLASVRSTSDSAFIDGALEFEAWLGASDEASEGTWTWTVDDQPFWSGTGSGSPVGGAYENWNSDEPNGGILSNCARALPRSFGSVTPNAPWADLGCEDRRGAICEEYPAP